MKLKKLRILAIKAIFDPKNPFLTNSIVDRIEIQAEITSFNMRYYMNLTKLRLPSRLATITKQAVGGAEGFWVAGLRVRQLKIGSKSCFAALLKNFKLVYGPFG